MAMNYGTANVAFGVASSLLQGKASRDFIKEQNKLELQAWNATVIEVRKQLGVAYRRTNTAISEANAAKIRHKMAIRKAAHTKIGERATSAATLGISGRRGTRDIYAGTEREAAGMLSEADINAQTEMDNLTNHFNDTALAAINQLNASAPLARAVPSWGGIIVGSMGTALDNYNSLSAAQKYDFKNTFKMSSNKYGLTPGASFNFTPAGQPVNF